MVWRESTKDFSRCLSSKVTPAMILFDILCTNLAILLIRDPSAVIDYRDISTSGFSHRHLLLIRWSRDQDMPYLSPLTEVVCIANRRTVKIEMSGISTAASSQSEAYVSTVALFIVFASSPKEEKAHLRLPPVWRDLWGEFVVAHREQIDAVDREELKGIRKLVEEIDEQEVTPQGANETEQSRQLSRGTNSCSLTSTKEAESMNAEGLAGLWSSRACKPSYLAMLKSRMTLPIWSFKDELLTAIENHQVVIICGETGCGKSTQVPAFILENELQKGRHCKIYCTEPRRISAISLARRVSDELGEGKTAIGTTRSLVGYAIRLESQVTAQTRLVYATTGIVMRMLEGSSDLGNITHLVLDEVHERTIDGDFLLIILRKLMLHQPGLKVILMSATVNAEHFSRYLNNAPIMNVPGRTFPVETKFLEDAIEVTNYGDSLHRTNNRSQSEHDDRDEELEDITKSDWTNLQGYSYKTRNMLTQIDEYRIEYELVVSLLETIATRAHYINYSKAILVFLPGIAEIRRLNDMLVGHSTFSQGWYVYPLHSTIATEEQEQAFLIPPSGVRKIVLATNIAETGITIPDVTCVIDAGKHKEMRYVFDIGDLM